MLKSVKLYGELAERYGKDWSLDMNSPSEAVRALSANNPGFKQFVGTSQDRGVGYIISVGGTDLEDPINELGNPSGKQEIKIIPAILGAKSKKSKDWMKVVAGIFIMAVAWQVGIAALGASSATTAAALTATSSAMMGIGVNLTMAGIGGLLTPTPKEIDESNNYAFSGAVNNIKQGVPVPICYGQLLVGSSVISSGISAGAY